MLGRRNDCGWGCPFVQRCRGVAHRTVARVRYGLVIVPNGDVQDPAELARMAEQRGFDCLLFPDHTHIPASCETPFPLGGELPDYFRRGYDPFVSIAAAVGATERILLGTGICLVVQRDPIITAKEIATLDCLSGGRFLFGIGAGWNLEEMRNHGTDPSTRFALMRERIAAMKAIWTQDEASYRGRHVEFERIWCWPKPVQKPHPPVLVGGNAPRVLDRVLAYGDEWMPNPMPLGELAERMSELRRRTEELGRPPIPVTILGCPAEPALVEQLAALGVGRVIFWLPSTSRDEVERSFEDYTALVQRPGLAEPTVARS
jgi:probable F420-dependent oxidoreductase